MRGSLKRPWVVALGVTVVLALALVAFGAGDSTGEQSEELSTLAPAAGEIMIAAALAVAVFLALWALFALVARVSRVRR